MPDIRECFGCCEAENNRSMRQDHAFSAGIHRDREVSAAGLADAQYYQDCDGKVLDTEIGRSWAVVLGASKHVLM